jgi:hypothetical protein
MNESKILTADQILHKWGKMLKDKGFELEAFSDDGGAPTSLRSAPVRVDGNKHMQICITYCTDTYRVKQEGTIRRIPDGWWEIRWAGLNKFHPPCTQRVIPDYFVTEQGLRLDDLDEWEWLRDYVCNQAFYITLGDYVEWWRPTENTNHITIAMPGFEPGWALVVKFS